MFAFFVCLSVCLPHKGGAWRVSVSESVCLTRGMLCVFAFLCLSVCLTKSVLGVFPSLSLSHKMNAVSLSVSCLYFTQA